MKTDNILYDAYPDYMYEKVTDITPSALRSMGVKAVALDLDSTAVNYSSFRVSNEIIQWVKQIREADIQVVIITNTVFLRAAYISKRMGNLTFYAFACKPNTLALRLAAKKLKLEPEEIAMIGDQLFTDVLSANRTGAVSVKVEPMGKEPPLAYFENKRQLERDYLAKCESGEIIPVGC